MKTHSMLKKLSGRMFYRVFLTYSTIIFVAMAILFVFLSEYYSDFIIQREVDKQETIVNQIKNEINEKHQFVNQGIRQLYLEERLIEDLAFALQHDYQEYIGYRLDKFSNSDSFVPYNFDIYVKNYFSIDPDVVALEIRNESLGTEYIYLYNHSKWHQTKFNSDIEMNIIEQHHNNVYIVEEQINDPVSLERLGNVSVYFTYENLNRLLSLREDNVQGMVFITDQDMNLYYSNNQIPIGIIEQLNYSSTQTQIKLDEVYYVHSSIETTSGLMVTAIIPKSEMVPLLTYRLTILSLILLLTFFAIALPYFSLRGYSKRVNLIVDKMREVQAGDLKVRIETKKYDDDLTIISDTFNETLEELNEYINKVYFSKLKQKEAELANLQAQINPHFLYNTLEAIRMKSLAEGGKSSAEMIVQLATLFRYSLKAADLVTIKEEQNHAHQYIELFKSRFKNQLKSDFHIDDKLKNYYVPPFILQPLIENFLLHGFRRGSEENRLIVTLDENDGVLSMEISDNGKGIEREKLLEIRKRLERVEGSSSSIGLGNVHQRIRLKYGASYGVSIESTLDMGTIVKVRLPIVSEVLFDDKSDVSG
ncbi:sensor histidine kinase [Alkalihalobacillus sp. 1P02AB]|uniref:sensor histidine kinase n=1 Tax=Alkalihalobacillus sp. 1P02AB TaxID=3132260 RepID=UPI0039A46FE3